MESDRYDSRHPLDPERDRRFHGREQRGVPSRQQEQGDAVEKVQRHQREDRDVQGQRDLAAEDEGQH